MALRPHQGEHETNCAVVFGWRSHSLETWICAFATETFFKNNDIYGKISLEAHLRDSVG
jgi:hypothetical protein